MVRPDGQLLQDLDAQPLSPSDRISGVIGYSLPEAAVVDGIVYAVERDRLVPIADV